MLKSHMAGFVCALALIACSQQAPVGGEGGDANSGDAAVGLNAPGLDTPAPAPASAPAAPAATPGVFSSGTFSARVEDVSIVKTCPNCLQGVLSVTLMNSAPAPISIILLDDGRARLTLNGGVVLSSLGWQDRVELNHCRSNDLTECWTRQSSEYAQIEPGSMLTVSFRMDDVLSTGEVATIPEIRTGSFATRLHIVESGGVDRAVNLSFSGLQVTNNAD